MKRAALYLRVSTADQNPDTQRCDLRQMAALRGYAVVETYTDTVSGAQAKRPRLEIDRQALLKDRAAGATLTELAQTYGISRALGSKVLREENRGGHKTLPQTPPQTAENTHLKSAV